jgi:hypothetical protein
MLNLFNLLKQDVFPESEKRHPGLKIAQVVQKIRFKNSRLRQRLLFILFALATCFL